MKKYKPGQVSAVLFSKKNGDASQSDSNPLGKLFSTPIQVKETIKKQITPDPDAVPPPTSKKRKRPKSPGPTKKDGDVSAKASLPPPKKAKTLKEDNVDNTHPNNVSSDLNTSSKSPAKKSLVKKKKVEKDSKTGDEEKQKRPRRDRQRDKTADKRTIFVGNCPLSADGKKLRKLFSQFGKIESVRIRCAPAGDPNLPRRAIVITKNFHEQCNSYVAYVAFEEEASAKKALQMNGHVLDKLHLRVDIAGSAKKHDKKRSVFVGNLPFTVSEEEIRSHFEDCGDISNVRIIRDRQTSLGKGFCYVQFQSKDSVSLAMKLNGSELQGRSLRVMQCVNKPKTKDKEENKGKNNKTGEKPKAKAKKPSFAPSNASGSAFKNLLKSKEEKRLRKRQKKKENAKKTDGLSSIFGDTPASGKISKKKNSKMGGKGNNKIKGFGTKSKPGQKGGSFKGKKTKRG